MKTSISAAFLALLLFFAVGCNNRTEELEHQNAALESSNTKLNQDLTARDEYVSNITDSINAVYVSIENLKTKETSLMKEQNDMESNKQLSAEDVRAKMGERLGVIRTTLSDDHKRINELSHRLATSKKQYAGLKELVDNMKVTLAERDKSIADLGVRIEGLEQDVHGLQQDITTKNVMMTQKDSVIDVQHNAIITAYYVAGTKDELEKMGVIKKEGGFLWGWLGSTTTLSSGFSMANFKPIDNTAERTIQVNGKIDEIIPKRSKTFYKQAPILDGEQTALTISDPEQFWKEKYLIIVTDRPGTSAIITGFIPIMH